MSARAPRAASTSAATGSLIGTDALVAEGIAARAASRDDGILVAPVLAYGPA